MAKASRKNRITPEEARRALYIDFEGRKDKAPVLLGCAHRAGRGATPWVWQAVTDPLFEPLTKADDSIELLPLPDAVERILQRAEANDRVIVAWTEHELKIVTKYCPQHLDRFEARFVNARSVAVRWRNACHGGTKPKTNKLADYLALIDYDVPDDAGPDRAADTIRIVGKALEKGLGLKGLTANQLGRWRDLRSHNLHDCYGMKKVCVLAAEELGAR
jgi:hypothetical protein